MEFEAIVMEERYRFSSLNQSSFLISGPRAEYILYNRNRQWQCADEIEKSLLEKLSDVLDRCQQPMVKS